MMEMLQSAMDEAVARQQLYADAEASYQDTVRSNKVYRAEDVKAFILARAHGGKPKRPKPVRLDPTKPMTAK